MKTRLGRLESIDEKKAAGQAINEAMSAVSSALDDRRSRARRRRTLAARVDAERLDLTEFVGKPTRGHAHLVTQAWERLEDVFIGLGFQVAEGPEVETDWHNFEALNMGEGHPARGEFDTLFVDHVTPGRQGRAPRCCAPTPRRCRSARCSTRSRRSTSSRRVGCSDATRPMPRTCRSSTRSRVWWSTVTSRWPISPARSRRSPRRSSAPGFTSRLRPSYFPFTEPSAEFDIQRPDGGWIELGGCGMVHPNVLRAGGLDPEEWSGFAFGFGIDRMAKERHGVEDIRDMYTNDIRFMEQFS